MSGVTGALSDCVTNREYSDRVSHKEIEIITMDEEFHALKNYIYARRGVPEFLKDTPKFQKNIRKLTYLLR